MAAGAALLAATKCNVCCGRLIQLPGSTLTRSKVFPTALGGWEGGEGEGQQVGWHDRIEADESERGMGCKKVEEEGERR